MIWLRMQANEEALAFLHVALPQFVQVWEPFPPFLAAENVIVISEAKRDPFPKKKVVQICRYGPINLNKREGVLAFLEEHLGVKIRKSQRAVLLELDDDDFYREAKLATVLKRFMIAAKAEGGSVFNLFTHLFDGFETAYCAYRECGLPHRAVFSALLTMFLKTEGNVLGASPAYSKALKRSKAKLPWFRKCVDAYVMSEMTELDFFSFLLELNDVRKAVGKS